jgi:hypothetical protein
MVTWLKRLCSSVCSGKRTPFKSRHVCAVDGVFEVGRYESATPILTGSGFLTLWHIPARAAGSVCFRQHREPAGDKRAARVDELHLTPLELIGRIAALVSPPRTHRHRYFGVLAATEGCGDGTGSTSATGRGLACATRHGRGRALGGASGQCAWRWRWWKILDHSGVDSEPPRAYPRHAGHRFGMTVMRRPVTGCKSSPTGIWRRKRYRTTR